ncbi:hypothetical protein GQ53DRAFT_778405 [Thozetella sp. PMI_491]|nr:hypothetical protein GQ53DRAFT_778405 [Thozetella sp. PMI_491]
MSYLSIETKLRNAQAVVTATHSPRLPNHSRTDILGTFDATLTGCMVVLSCFESTVEKLNASDSGPQKSIISRWRTRTRISAVSFLVQLLQMESVDEVLEEVKSSGRFLRERANRAQSLRQANPQVQVAASVLGSKRGANTIFGDAVTLLEDREFDFDNSIVNSKTYRRAWRLTERAKSGESIMTLPNMSLEMSYGMLPTGRPESIQTVRETPVDGTAEARRPSGDEPDHIQLAELEKEKQELKARLEESERVVTELRMTVHDIDHFDIRFQQLFSSLQNWVLLFSKFSDMQASRLTSDIVDEKSIDRLYNTILDDTDVDTLMADRVKRRDVLMLMMMCIIWDFIFTRCLFGMSREDRQRLKTYEKRIAETANFAQGAASEVFQQQHDMDTEAVVQESFQTLSHFLPPPSHMEGQMLEELRKIVRKAVTLSVEMRMQPAECTMPPPLQPDYNSDGELVATVAFNASLTNERGDRSASNEELGAEGAVVQMVLFPLVVRKGRNQGDGDDDVIVLPAQVLVNRKLLAVVRGSLECRIPAPEHMSCRYEGNLSIIHHS